ncbi:MAG: HTTM domain-containing protein [Chthoniobacteraceae bacterium]
MEATLLIAQKPPPVVRPAKQGETPPSTGWWSTAFGIDTRSLGAFRIGLAILLLCDLAIRCTDIPAHYSDWGLLPRTPLVDHLLGNLPFVSIHLISGSSYVIAALFAVAAFFALCLLVGYKSKISTIISWFMLSSLHTRNPMILQGGDVLLRMLLFWGMFLPLDAAFVPGRLDSKRAILSMATAALLLQVCCVYFFGALLKTDPAWTVQHSAVYNALSIEQFSTPLGRWLLAFPALLRLFTVTTRWMELIGPCLAVLPLPLFLPWARQRIAIVLAFVGFHISMGLCLHLGLFSAICSVAWIPFLPGEFWDRIAPFTGRAGLFLARLPLPSVGYTPSPVSAAHRAVIRRLANAAALVFLVYVIHWNIRTVNPRIDLPMLHRLDWMAQLFRLDQTWDMFAPAPLREDGWYVVPGLLADGSMADIRRDGPVDWQKPAIVSANYKNDRWRKYMVNLAAQQHTWYRAPYAEYLRRKWNEEHPASQRLVSVWIYYMMVLTRPDGGKDKPVPILLWQYKWDT